MTIPAVTIPAVTIPGVTIPGVHVHGLDVNEASSPPASAHEATVAAASTPAVCAPEVKAGGYRPSVYRGSVYRGSAYRGSVYRGSVYRGSGCIPEGCIPPVSVDPVSVDAVDMPPVDVPAAELPAVQLPEAPQVDVFQGQGQTAYVVPTDVLFDFDKSELHPDAVTALRQVAASLAQRFPDASVEIDGHTDAVGTDAYNQGLSEKRAEAMRDWLVANASMAPNRLTTKGFGATVPVAPEKNPDGSDNPDRRTKNRRVVVVVRT